MYTPELYPIKSKLFRRFSPTDTHAPIHIQLTEHDYHSIAQAAEHLCCNCPVRGNSGTLFCSGFDADGLAELMVLMGPRATKLTANFILDDYNPPCKARV